MIMDLLNTIFGAYSSKEINQTRRLKVKFAVLHVRISPYSYGNVLKKYSNI